MTISKKAIEAIKGNNRILARLMLKFDKSSQTLALWLGKTPVDVRLTTPDAVKIISEESGLTEGQILLREKETV